MEISRRILCSTPWCVDDVTNAKEERPGHAKQGCEGWQDIPDSAYLI